VIQLETDADIGMGVRRAGNVFFATGVISNGPAHRAGIENGACWRVLVLNAFSNNVVCIGNELCRFRLRLDSPVSRWNENTLSTINTEPSDVVSIQVRRNEPLSPPVQSRKNSIERLVVSTSVLT
jgi:hypothetical protein